MLYVQIVVALEQRQALLLLHVVHVVDLVKLGQTKAFLWLKELVKIVQEVAK